jgi:hypothetical protein
MSSPLSAVRGKVFTHPLTKESYGPIRPPSQDQFSTLDGTSFDAIGEDTCGNGFAVAKDGAVLFWDHETDDLIPLAASVSEFVANCIDSAPVELNPEQVKSVWIDPEFAKLIGKKAPKDGWVKKKGQ